MTVWVEQARWNRLEQLVGHLLSHDLDALHALASQIDLDRAKFFNRHALIPHYSIPEALVQHALDAGAVELQPRERDRVLGRVRHVLVNRELVASERGPDALPRRRKGQQSLFEK